MLHACEAGSLQSESRHLYRARYAGGGAEMTAARLDPAPALSRRSALRANLCRRWRLRMFYRWQCDPLDLRFPIPNDDVLDSLNAAKRQLAANQSAADARWADEISTKGGAQGPLDPTAHSRPSTFYQIQSAMLSKHKQAIVQELGTGTTFKPVCPDSRHDFTQRFLASGADLPTAAYHGTPSRNLSSICRRGLLIPGHGGVTVQHGSTHGVGIYVAQMGAAWLSLGFSDGGYSILICGVVDEAARHGSGGGGDAPRRRARYVSILKFRDKSRRDIGKSQSKWTAVLPGTALGGPGVTA
jgi:hypothetical protein